MSKKWMALVAMTALIGGVASVGCSSDDADNNDKGGNDTDAGAGGEGGEGGSGGEGGEGGTGGTGGQGGQGGGGNSCDANLEWSSDETCQSCMEDMCCAEMAECEEGSDCEAALECVNACPTGAAQQACVVACRDENPDGFNAIVELQTCFENDCQEDYCAVSDICGSGSGYPDAECNECLTDSCCDVFDPCLEDANCSACLQGSGQGCDEDELFQEYSACRAGECKVACFGPANICGSDWGYGKDADQATIDHAACLGEKCCDHFMDCGGGTLCGECLEGKKTGAACDSVKDQIDALNACEDTECP